MTTVKTAWGSADVPGDVGLAIPMDVYEDVDRGNQGPTSDSILDTKPKKLTVRERLDRLSPSYRIRPSSIRATAKPRGSGGKAEVFRASFKRNKTARSERVATKKLRFGDNTDREQTSKEFVHEVELLAGLSHENIVQLIGFVEDLERDKAWIVLSWEPNGNVREFLASGKWEIPERISLIQDMFEGLEYLHTRQPPIRHGDLKSLNILVSSSYRAVITDFGSARALSRAEHQTVEPSAGQVTERASARAEHDTCQGVRIVATADQLTLTGPAWSLRWAAPEVLNATEDLGLSSDIWSAGWVCWEVMTDKLPFPELQSDVDITLQIVQKIDRLTPDQEEMKNVVALCNLMADCWEFEPDSRPQSAQCTKRVKWMPVVRPLGGISSRAKASSVALLLEMGSMYYLRSNNDAAESLFHRALANANASDDEESGALALLGLADVSRGRSKYLDAGVYYTRALNVYSRLGNETGQAETFEGLGEIYRLQHKFTEAERFYTQARNIYIRIDDAEGQASTLIGLGDVYQLQSKDTEAEGCFIQACDICIRMGDDRSQAHTLNGLGDVYRSQAKYLQAEECYTKARELYIRIGDELGRANTLQGLGHVCHSRSEYSEAEIYFIQAQEVYKRIGDSRGQVHTLQELGDIYRSQSKYPEAEGCYKRAQEMYIHTDDDLSRADTLQGLGDIYRSQSKYPEAEGCYKQAEELYTRIGNDLRRAHTLWKMGHVYCGESNYQEAEGCYTRARDVYAHIRNDQGQANALRKLGNVYCLQSRCQEAEGCYISARDIYMRVGDDHGQARTVHRLGHLRQQQDRYVEAAEFYEEARDLDPRMEVCNAEDSCFAWLSDVSDEQSCSICAASSLPPAAVNSPLSSFAP
ncbi:hypothetical protein M407DRAFT_27347 [Tulasnella calospora MUT 4182]|uniref:Protein kinase domain-containing protein n=1 Tax=Tulasnella calospora MUT 4182 TaxID=1051891 RepID=A0A0C3QE32_9AGAM|nr:hypothetical protein M407DRAFT_27347 [Tulasnella calospora MUT 4182]